MSKKHICDKIYNIFLFFKTTTRNEFSLKKVKSYKIELISGKYWIPCFFNINHNLKKIL